MTSTPVTKRNSKTPKTRMEEERNPFAPDPEASAPPDSILVLFVFNSISVDGAERLEEGKEARR